MNKVQEHFNKHHQSIGTRQLALYLNNDEEVPVHIGRKRMTRIMSEQNLTCRIRQKKHNRVKKQEQELSENILNRDFEVLAPNQVWLTDFTELRFGVHGEHKVRLGAVLDLYGRRIISYNISAVENSAAAIQCFHRAFESEGNVRPLIHTDRGSAYTSKSFNLYLAKHKVIHSMSRPGTPYDNAPIERWWNDFKLNWMDGHYMPRTYHELVKLVEAGIRYFNEEVRSTKRNGLTPEEYWNQAI